MVLIDYNLGIKEITINDEKLQNKHQDLINQYLNKEILSNIEMAKKTRKESKKALLEVELNSIPQSVKHFFKKVNQEYQK
jgi:hypothetical protein